MPTTPSPVRAAPAEGAPAWAVPVLVVLVAVTTALGAALGSGLETLGAWWPASGLAALAVLLVAPRRVAPVVAALAVVVLLGGLVGGRGAAEASALAVVDAAEAALAGLLVRRTVGLRLERSAQVAPLVGGLAVAAVLGGAGVAVVTTTLGATTQGTGWGTTFLVAGLAHAAALLVLVPPAMLPPGLVPAPWRRVVAPGLLSVALAVVAISPLTSGVAGLTLIVLPLVLMAVMATREDTRAVALVLVALAVAVSACVVAFPGSLGDDLIGPTAKSQLVQVYLVTLALLLLPLGMATCERVGAARQLAHSEQVFRGAFTRSAVPVLLATWRDGALVVSAASDACARLLDQPATALADRDLDELVSAPPLWEALGQGPLEDFPGWSGAIRVRTVEHARVEAYCSLIDSDPASGSALVSLHLVDLTEDLALRQRLDQERTRSRHVMDAAASIIVITDLEGRVTTVNTETTRLSGWRAEELVGRPLWDVLVAPGDRQATADALTGELPVPRAGELRVVTRDGDERQVRFFHTPHEPDGGGAPILVFSATDVTDERESANMVKHLLRSVVSIAFVGTDLRGRVTLFGSGAERLFGLRADQAHGRTFTSMLSAPPDGTGAATRPDLTQLLGAAGAEGSPHTQDWRALPPGRPPVSISMTCDPVHSGSGATTGYLFVARDVTDTRRNQEIMVKALERERQVVTRLQALDRAKDDFVSTVSHELRTPMSSIIGSAELLADGLVGELEASQHRLVDVITRNGARLLGLADDLLTLATFDQDQPTAAGAPLDLRRVVVESVGAVRPGAGADRIVWEVDLPAEPVPVLGEELHLERAVTNLLTNAVKFTPSGGTVGVDLRADAAAGTATVVVSDTGRGIPAADLEHVFDRFYRSPDAQERAVQGSGLGLAIVKQIVERHGGSITLDSRLGEGTAVAITVPIHHHEV